MKRYAVTGTVTISVHVEVLADTEAQARRLASEMPMQRLCAGCADGDNGESWCTNGELDGEPKIKEVREVRKVRSAR